MLMCLSFIGLLACACGQVDVSDPGGTLTQIIDQVLGPPGAASTINEHSTLVPAIVEKPNSPVTCTTDKGEDGECVKYYLCSSEGTVITDGEGILNARSGGTCLDTIEVCCLVKDVRPDTDAPQPKPEIVSKPNATTAAPINKPSTLVPAIVPKPPATSPVTCTTDKGEDGECVKYYLCSSEGTVITDGEGILNARSGGTCLDTIEVCCLVKDVRPDTDAPQPTPEITGKPDVTTAAPVNKPSTLVPAIASTPDGASEACVTNDGEEGECVIYYLCNSDNTVITDGAGIINTRLSGTPCLKPMEVCCLVKNVKPNEPPPKRLGCGWRNADGVGVIVRDLEGEAKFGEFPWMVAVYRGKIGNTAGYLGGGSLINPGVVLTAAHTVAATKHKEDVFVRAGEWDTQNTREIYPHQDRMVANMALHEDFNNGNLFYDVAVLFLRTPMDLTQPNVGLACLPSSRHVTPEDTRCYATGWGKDKFGKQGLDQVVLKKVELPVVARGTCQSRLRATRLGRHFELHSSFMCAGGEPGKDTCKGDGGSPLSCPIKNDPGRYMQSGIVAWGIGCGEDGTPGVYVDVANVRAWIDDKVAGKGYEPRTYTY